MTKDSMLTKELYDALTDLLINVEEDVPRECMSKHLIVAIEEAAELLSSVRDSYPEV